MYAHASAEKGMEDLEMSQPQHYAEVFKRLSENPFKADERVVEKLAGSRQWQHYEYRLSNAYRPPYLLHRANHGFEIPRVRPHF